jgi:hypothetical protein
MLENPSFKKGNQNAPKCNFLIILLGTMKTMGSIVESHDDESDKRNKALLLQDQKWEAGWTLPSIAWT